MLQEIQYNCLKWVVVSFSIQYKNNDNNRKWPDGQYVKQSIHVDTHNSLLHVRQDSSYINLHVKITMRNGFATKGLIGDSNFLLPYSNMPIGRLYR